MTYSDEGYAELAEHARLNPGTTRIEDMAGNVLWAPIGCGPTGHEFLTGDESLPPLCCLCGQERAQ